MGDLPSDAELAELRTLAAETAESLCNSLLISW